MPRHSTEAVEELDTYNQMLVAAVLAAVAREAATRRAYGPNVLTAVAGQFGVRV